MANTTIASLNTVVTANAVQHINELNRAAKATTGFVRGVKTGLSTLGVGLSVGGVIAFGKEILDLGGQIVDLSRAAGLGTTQFQTLANVGMASGVSMEDVAKASENMRSHIQDAAAGSKPMVEAFSKLNLTAAGLQALAPEQQWEVIAKRISSATNQQEALNIASDIFGAKLGPKMREVLEVVGQGFDKAGAATAALSFTPEQLKSLDDAGDKLAELFKMAKVGAAKGFLGVMDKGGGFFSDMFAAMQKQSDANEADWAKNNMVDRGQAFRGAGAGGSWGDPTTESKGTANNPVVVAFDAATEAKMKAGEDAKARAGGLTPAMLRAMDKEDLLNTDPLQSKLAADDWSKPTDEFKETRSDSLQRIGLLTGQKNEPEKQTALLKSIHLVLTQMYRENLASGLSVFGD